MQNVLVSDRAAKAIEYLRKEREYQQSCMCMAMRRVIEQINDNMTGTIIPYNISIPWQSLLNLKTSAKSWQLQTTTNPKRQNNMAQLVFIKPACKRARITLQELAERIGISYEGVKKIAHGKAYPKPQTLQDIAMVLQVPVWHLFVNPTEARRSWTRRDWCDAPIAAIPSACTWANIHEQR